MALPNTLDVYANDVICMTGDSLLVGNADGVSVRMMRGFRPLITPFYQRMNNGLGRVPGAAMAFGNTYDMGCPHLRVSGIIGDPIETCTANFNTRVGVHSPNILIIGLGANNFTDAIPGVLNPKIDALLAKVTDPTQYARRKVPEGFLWWGCAWRGQETPGGTNQAALLAMNAVINTKVVAAGGIFVDTQNIWLNTLPIPPANTYTDGDGTHFSAAGATFVAQQIMNRLTLHPEMRY